MFRKTHYDLDVDRQSHVCNGDSQPCLQVATPKIWIETNVDDASPEERHIGMSEGNEVHQVFESE